MRFDLGTFGDGNPYTIFSHDLKSVLTSVPNDAWDIFQTSVGVGTGLAPLVSDRGTKFQDINGDETGYRFTTLAASSAQLPYEGHIKFRAERQLLCAGEVDDNGNSGDTLPTAQRFLSNAPLTGGAQVIFGKAATSTASAKAFVPKSGGSGSESISLDFRNFIMGSEHPAQLHTAGKSADVDIDIFWKGKYAFYAVDGTVVNVTDQRSLIGYVDLFKNFYIGSERGIATTFTKDYWFSNLEIRTKCPEFSLNYASRQIGILSDSIFDDAAVSAANAGDVSAQFRIQRQFNKQGQYTNINISENAGYRIYNTGTNWLGDTAPIAAALANNPVKVFSVGGLNDSVFASDITSVQFQAAYLDILEKLLGENGNDATSVNEVVCVTPIPLRGTRSSADYSAWVGKATEFRTVIAGLPDLWDATYPLRAGAVTVKDAFTAMGGESEPVADDLYVGELDGTLENVHLAAHGMQVYGDFLA